LRNSGGGTKESIRFVYIFKAEEYVSNNNQQQTQKLSVKKLLLVII
jgi:hypothetical protein